MDFFDLMMAGGGGGATPSPAEEKTFSGAPPLSYESNGEPASAYSIAGNMSYSGTPTPANPISVQEVGDLIESGEHAGEYAIPITTGGEPQTIYLDEPLRKFGEYSDALDSTGKITRRIYKITLTGGESWSYTASMQKMLFSPSNFPEYRRELELVGICNQYEFVQNQASASLTDGKATFLVSGSGVNAFYLRDNNYATSDAFKEHLAALYEAGTPVCIWYVLGEASEDTFSAPTITPARGSNTFAFETDLQPSFASITCMVGGGGSVTANKVTYNNSASGLSATNVQKAIDEVARANSRLYGTGFARESGSLSAGESFTLPMTNCKKNDVFSFMAKITSFSGLLIGQGLNTYSGSWAEVTATKLIVHNYTNSDSATEYAHGLTISDYIYVQIIKGISKADIVITSGGETFKQTEVTWSGGNGAYFAKSDGSTLADCTFSWGNPDFRKPVWVFGDSYIGLNNPARWATQFRNAGFAENVLFNGYAGEASASAITALTNALENYGCPETLIWCMGMNDGADANGTPSANYASGISQVETLCRTYGIKLIYATIPSVPSQNNEGKNAYVRGTGKRFIDFAKAVGASASGVWYSGMLSQDNVHPDEIGAVALYHQAIADCPELTFSNP